MPETQQAPLTSTLDTVAVASGDPGREQPWADLGLKADEYARIREILGRRPTSSELAMYSVMWSEHCSYKSSKVHLKQFCEIPQETPVGKMLAGIGENAGVLDIGQGYAVTFKVESHNHPSYVEPYQGAATGVGGIVRDILAMGARPVAVMDPLRFGPLDAPDTHRVLPGIVAGVGGYGNCLGLPNIGGEAVFDDTYLGNPLVNALCVGVLRHEDLHLAKASGVGNQVILYGARTGGDGIGGVSVLASETFDADGPAKRPSVQVGDPFMEKLLIECTLEIFAAGLVAGIQDLGGAGLSCATSELASAGDGGMHVELDRVPLRDSTLAPEEILMSESQERMMAVVEPGDVDAFMAICAKWDVEAVVVGEVTDTGRLQIDWHGERVVDVPPRSVAHDGPTYQRPYARPSWQDALQADGAEALARPASGDDLRATLLRLVASAQPVRQVVDHRPVRPLRPRQHRARPARGQRHGARRRRDQPRRLGRHRLQRPVRQARPLHRRPARAGRVLPQRRHRRRPPARHLRLPQLRLPGGPRRDVAVRRGLPRAQGRLPRARHPGDRRQRQPLQPDRRDRDPAHARRGRARGDRRRHQADAVATSPPPASASSCSARPARSSPGRSGRTSCTGTSAACRRGSTWRPSRPWAPCWPTRRAMQLSPAPTTCPTVDWPRPWRRPPSATGSGSRCRWPTWPAGTRFVALFSESAARAIVTVTTDNADRLVALAERHGVPLTPDRADRRRHASRSRAGSRCPSPSCATPGAPPCRPPWPDPRRAQDPVA